MRNEWSFLGHKYLGIIIHYMQCYINVVCLHIMLYHLMCSIRCFQYNITAFCPNLWYYLCPKFYFNIPFKHITYHYFCFKQSHLLEALKVRKNEFYAFLHLLYTQGSSFFKICPSFYLFSYSFCLKNFS